MSKKGNEAPRRCKGIRTHKPIADFEAVGERTFPLTGWISQTENEKGDDQHEMSKPLCVRKLQRNDIDYEILGERNVTQGCHKSARNKRESVPIRWADQSNHAQRWPKSATIDQGYGWPNDNTTDKDAQANTQQK